MHVIQCVYVICADLQRERLPAIFELNGLMSAQIFSARESRDLRGPACILVRGGLSHAGLVYGRRPLGIRDYKMLDVGTGWAVLNANIGIV